MILRLVQGIIRMAAMVVTAAQSYTGLCYCKVIYQKGSTKNIPLTPFIGGLVMSVLLIQQSSLLAENAMHYVHVFGLLLNVAYASFYYFWSKKDVREKMVKHLAVAFVGVTLLILYSLVEHPSRAVGRFSFLVTLVMLGFAAAPLIRLPEILEKKSTAGMPFPTIFSGFAVSAVWLIYSIVTWNGVLFLQNAAMVLVLGFQLSLFIIYPDTSLKSRLKIE